MDIIAKLTITWVLILGAISMFGFWEIDNWRKRGWKKDYGIRWWLYFIWVGIPVTVGFIYMWVS